MIHFKRVQQSLCDPLTFCKKVYKDSKSIKKPDDFFIACLVFIDRRLNVVSNDYWSTTTNASNTSNAWNVNFNNGNDNWNNKSNDNYVCCVRSTDNDRVYDV